jgi:DNA-nicking Smr family endonuclease
MAGRARSLTETDAAEWARYAERITPLSGALTRMGVAPVNLSETTSAHAAPETVQRFLRPAAAKTAQSPPLGVGGQPPGVDAASWQRFRRGQLASARKLDLHGMTAQQAFHALRGFLRTAQTDGLRCVEIVTGRGNGEHGGVLRREFALWLNLPDIRPMVLAAVHPHTSSAMHSHMANPGSVRLLLRRPRA